MIFNNNKKTGNAVYSNWPSFFLFIIIIILFLDIGTKYSPRADSTGTDPGINPEIEALYTNLANTRAVGTFTKLSINNNARRLQQSFAVYHEGKRPPSLEELKERYDLMIQEIMILVQDKDPELAREVHTSRQLLWSYLSDPEKFKYL